MSAIRRLLAAFRTGAVCLVLLVGLTTAVWAQSQAPNQPDAAAIKAAQEKAAQEKGAQEKAAQEKAAEEKKAQAKAAEAKAAREKAAEEKAAEEKAAADAPNALWLEASVRLTGALQDLLAALMTGVSWAIVALVVLFLFRERLLEVFVQLVETIRERGGSVDVGAFKLQIADRPADEVDEARPLFLSPFELDDERGPDGGLLWDIPPQYEYQVSDSVGEYRKTHLGGGAVAASMKQELDALEAACKRGDAFAALKPQLVKYVVALEEARFLDASSLAELMASPAYPLGSGIKGLRPAALPADAADFLIVHAGAIALAQHGDMEGSLALLKDIPFTDKPLYVPAGAMWLTASYNCLIAAAKAADTPLDSPEMMSKLRGFVDRASTLAEALKTLNWTTVQLKAPKAYYEREFAKDIGSILSIYAEFGPLPERKTLLLEARPHLEASVRQPDPNEPPTSLDHNNLADLYRQLALADPATAAQLVKLAHGELDQALAKDVDPTFHATRALVFLAERRTDEAAKVLEPYIGDSRDDRLCATDRIESVQNQLLAAKISVKRFDDAGVPLAIRILESALTYVARIRVELKGEAEDFEADITELLSFAHLRINDYPKAVEWFDTLIASPGWRDTFAARLRARVGRALALGGWARRERRQSSYGTAKRLRERAAQDVAEILGLMKNTVKLDTPGKQRLVEGLWLDGVRALQLMAEELYAGFESTAAQDLAGPLAPLLAALAAPPAAGDTEAVERRRVLRRVRSRHALLTARLLLRLEPNMTQETLAKVVAALQGVRGAEPALDCQADLEEGVARLTAVRLSIGDVEREYTQAIEALERASREDVPALRGETIRVLAQAYAMRPLLRRKKKSATK